MRFFGEFDARQMVLLSVGIVGVSDFLKALCIVLVSLLAFPPSPIC